MSNEEYLLRTVELDPELVIFNNVLEKIENEYLGADFTLGHELEINYARILYDDYPPEDIGAKIAYNALNLLSNYVCKRFNAGLATFISEDFNVTTPASTVNNPNWNKLYTKALSTPYGVVNEFNLTIEDVYFQSEPKKIKRFNAWQKIGKQLLEDKKVGIVIIGEEED